MPGNPECLQFTCGPIVHCRWMPGYGYDPITGECPLEICEARKVLEDETLFKRVAGKFTPLGSKDQDVRGIIFHLICPGTLRMPNVTFEEAAKFAEIYNG